MSNKHTISYVYAINSKGYLQDIKYRQEIDLDNPPLKGTMLSSFYKEDFIFENINGITDGQGNISFFENNTLVVYSQNQINQKIKELLNQFYQQTKASNHPNLIGKRLNENYPASLLEKLYEGLKYNGIDLTDKNVKFDFREYQKIQNELIFLTHQSNLIDIKNSPHNLVHNVVIGVNTLLATEQFIEIDLNSNAFKTERDEETEQYYVSYSDASNLIHNVYLDSKSLIYFNKTHKP